MKLPLGSVHPYEFILSILQFVYIQIQILIEEKKKIQEKNILPG